MKLYLRDLKTISILIVMAIIAISYGLFFYFQSITENQIKTSLFSQQEQRQQESTRAIAKHIESDLSLLASNLRNLAESPSFQITDGALTAEAKTLLQGTFLQINTDSRADTVTIIDRLYALDEDGIIIGDAHAGDISQNFEGADISLTEYFAQAKSTLLPVFSKGISGLDGNYKIAISYPILDENGSFSGMLSAEAPVSTFFRHYGNVYDIQSQYLAVLDRDSVQLVHPLESLVGTPFFGEYAQETTGRLEVLNTLVASVMAGEPAQAVYVFRDAERLTTGHPIYLGGEPTYFVFIITPTNIIYANIDDALSIQRIETFSLLAGTTATIFVLIIFLAMWNSSLRKAVRAKTDQLVDSNRQLSIANEQLIENYERLHASEKMQKEFVNIAAHELRTPVQPIIGLSEILLRQQWSDPETRSLMEAMHRNAMRLFRLSSDILDVTKIESGSMQLSKRQADIVGLVREAVEEAKDIQIADGKISLVLLEPQDKHLPVFADDQRIQQVLHNLIGNAIKFTEKGTITVMVEKKDNEVIVQVTDTGQGIDPEIFPRLFTKFASKSEKGTGLGLYISKSIVEAHGGRIWGEDNRDGKGATFAFSLPLASATPAGTSERF